jgi:hypothetical protein
MRTICSWPTVYSGRNTIHPAVQPGQGHRVGSHGAGRHVLNHVLISDHEVRRPR